jgi:multiple sugar transport system permease protein
MKLLTLGSPKGLNLRVFLFLGPVVAIILGVLLYPMVRSVMTGFTDRMFSYDRYSYVGLANYAEMVKDPLFWQALLNSTKLTLGSVIASLAVGLGLALLLNSNVKGRNLFQALLFLPWAMTSTVAALIFRWFYNDIYGYLNFILMKLGILSESVNLLARTNTVWIAILIPIIWTFYPFAMLIFLATLQSIDRSLYEAATIDGANRWQSFRHVTLPALKPIMAIVVVLLTIWSFSTFDLVSLLTGGGPGNATLTLSVYIYRQGFEAKMLGYASAMGTVMLVVLVAFTLLFFWVGRKTRLYED